MADARDPQPLLCPACKVPLGVTTDDTLFVGGMRLFREFMFACTKCDNVKVWRPGGFRERKPLDNAAARGTE